jgi:CNP1-like family protein
LRAAAAVLCTALAACGSGQQVSDWERRNPELVGGREAAPAPTPPPMPRKENLIEFYVGPQATFRYYIDAASLSALYKQKEVRYLLVARSPSGVENLSYEAIRCPDMHRIYAVGDADKWSVRPSEWQDIQRRTGLGVPGVLAREYFCPHRDPLQSAAEGVDALRRGGHPLVYTEPRSLGR